MDSTSIEVGETERGQVQSVVGNDVEPGPGGNETTACRKVGWTALDDRLLEPELT